MLLQLICLARNDIEMTILYCGSEKQVIAFCTFMECYPFSDLKLFSTQDCFLLINIGHFIYKHALIYIFHDLDMKGYISLKLCHKYTEVYFMI